MGDTLKVKEFNFYLQVIVNEIIAKFDDKERFKIPSRVLQIMAPKYTDIEDLKKLQLSRKLLFSQKSNSIVSLPNTLRSLIY